MLQIMKYLKLFGQEMWQSRRHLGQNADRAEAGEMAGSWPSVFRIRVWVLVLVRTVVLV